MKKIMGTAALLAVLTLTVGCASKDSNTAETSKTEEKAAIAEVVVEEAPAPVSTNQYDISDDRYQDLLDKSLVSVGNTVRMKKVIEKLNNGEPVYIAALGGSVTEGAGPANFKDGYAYQFTKKLKAAYCTDGGKNVYFDGAGLSGTPSQLGLIRYESDVVQVLGHNPDLLIIEFAVNDNGGDSSSTRAFEALVRNALLANEDCAVIALYSAATYGNSAAQKMKVAEHYGIPQVNVLIPVKMAISAGDFPQNKYYTDSVHPTKEGHEFQADCIMNMIAKAVTTEDEEPVAVPENWCMEKPFTNFTRILGDDSNVKIAAGSFSATDKATQSIKKTNKANFPQNWSHETGAESFVMNINCKALILTYKEQGSWLTNKFGKAEVYVDGALKAIYDGGPAGGWNNCVPVVIIDEATAANHKVEIKMAAGDEAKGFTIVAMGYSK